MGNHHVKFGCVSAPLDGGHVDDRHLHTSQTSTRKLAPCATSYHHDRHDLSLTSTASASSCTSSSSSSTPIPPIYEHGHFEHIHDRDRDRDRDHEHEPHFASFSGAESLSTTAHGETSINQVNDNEHATHNHNKQNVKLLFLDVDGVLNNATTSWDEYHSGLDDQLLKYLKYIVVHTGCKIVLSTTWRLNANAKAILLHTLKTRADINTDDVVIGQTFSLKANGLHRVHEIYHYLKYNEHRLNVVSWCAVDDLALNKFDSLSKQIMSGHFVRTNAKIGLSPHNALSCVAILNQFDDEYNPYDYRR